MADTSFGSTFQPGDQTIPPWMRGGGGYGGAPAGGGAGFSPVQQAVKILSLRLPQVFGAQAPLSRDLMNSMHGGLTQPSAVARSVIANTTGGGQRPPIPAPGAGQFPQQLPNQFHGYRIPGMPSGGEAANLGNVISQIPRPRLPNISMIQPGGGNLPTQIGGSMPHLGGYAPAPPQPPQPPQNIVPIGAAGPGGNVYSGPPAGSYQPPPQYVNTNPSQYGGGGFQYPTSFNPYGNAPRFGSPY